MRIGVLSDTHIPIRAPHLPKVVVETLANVDLIVHAGDFVTDEVYEELRQLSRLEAVAGNMDSQRLTELLPPQKTFVIDGLRIGLIHGWGGPWDLPQRVRTCFQADIDCIIFGHSHQAYNVREEKTLLFNPGSPVFSTNRTFGILHIEKGNIIGEIMSC